MGKTAGHVPYTCWLASRMRSVHVECFGPPLLELRRDPWGASFTTSFACFLHFLLSCVMASPWLESGLLRHHARARRRSWIQPLPIGATQEHVDARTGVHGCRRVFFAFLVALWGGRQCEV